MTAERVTWLTCAGITALLGTLLGFTWVITSTAEAPNAEDAIVAVITAACLVALLYILEALFYPILYTSGGGPGRGIPLPKQTTPCDARSRSLLYST